MTEETPKEADTLLTKTSALKLLTLPSGAKVLHTKCKRVETITPAIKALIQALEGYLKGHQQDTPRPVGIAAPQLGKTVRIFSFMLGGAVFTVINPELMYEKKKRLVVETCLSIPGRSFILKRGKVVKIRGTLADGSVRSLKGHDLTAQVFMHELVHLNGITIDTVAGGTG